jgi:gas vesicle protein
MIDDRETNKDGSFNTGAIFGFMAGVLTGLLFAPTEGQETRRKVKKQIDEKLMPVLEKAAEKAQQLNEPMKAAFVEKIQQLTDDVEEKATSAIDDKVKRIKKMKKKLFDGVINSKSS